MKGLKMKALAWGLACTAALTAAARADGTAETDAEVGRTTAVMMYTEWMDAFRRCGMDEPAELAGRFLDGTAQYTWERDVSRIYDPVSVSDFFTGAIPLLGPFDAEHCIIGLFNPHWNAILLLQTEGAVPTDDDEEVQGVPKATRLYFMSGEAFCGENPDTPDFGTVLPGGGGIGEHTGDPLSAGLWRASEKAFRRFDSLYGVEREEMNSMRLTELGILGLDADKDRDRLLPRVAVHLQNRARMWKSPQSAVVARRMEDVLRQASMQLMGIYFGEPHHMEFVRSYSNLETAFHKGMEAYGYVERPDGSLYLFVNRNFPRIYATVHVPRREDGGKPRKEDVSFEWFDLGQAESLNALWQEHGKDGGR